VTARTESCLSNSSFMLGRGGCLLVCLLMLMLIRMDARADGLGIGKVYHPYVQQLESEVELQTIYQKDNNDKLDGNQTHKLGVGKSFSDTLFGEIYMLADKSSGEAVDFSGYEAELKMQLTEQGEYGSDWGLLFELERNISQQVWSYSTTLIMLHEWARWVGTLNADVEVEWGSGLDDEVETALAGQIRFRYTRSLEPGFELFAAQDTNAVGPVLMGQIRHGGANRTLWQTALAFGLNSKTPDVTMRVNLEFEF